MPNYADQLRAVDMAEQKLIAKRFRLIEKAAKSDNPTDMIAAAQTIDKMQHKPQENAKAYLYDISFDGDKIKIGDPTEKTVGYDKDLMSAIDRAK